MDDVMSFLKHLLIY